jgi:hypothetical protein
LEEGEKKKEKKKQRKKQAANHWQTQLLQMLFVHQEQRGQIDFVLPKRLAKPTHPVVGDHWNMDRSIEFIEPLGMACGHDGMQTHRHDEDCRSKT